MARRSGGPVLWPQDSVLMVGSLGPVLAGLMLPQGGGEPGELCLSINLRELKPRYCLSSYPDSELRLIVFFRTHLLECGSLLFPCESSSSMRKRTLSCANEILHLEADPIQGALLCRFCRKDSSIGTAFLISPLKDIGPRATSQRHSKAFVLHREGHVKRVETVAA